MLTNIDKDPVVAASASVACTQATKSSVLKLVKEIEDYKRKISFMEEQVSYLEGDMTNLYEFKCVLLVYKMS